jgi:hypothetical protein
MIRALEEQRGRESRHPLLTVTGYDVKTIDNKSRLNYQQEPDKLDTMLKPPIMRAATITNRSQMTY